jgi:hypothetical protein
MICGVRYKPLSDPTWIITCRSLRFQLVAHLCAERIDLTGKSFLKIDAARNDLDRPMPFVVSSLSRFWKQNISSRFGKYDESVRLSHDPCFGALCEPKKKPAGSPNTRVGIFLGHESANVEKDLWFRATELSNKHRDQRGDMHSRVQDVEIIFL